MEQTNSKPEIYGFTDYRAFLKEFYRWKKEQDNGFSHAVFAERAGLKSRSFLRLVLTGKRNLSAEGTTKFAKGCELDLTETKAFEALVLFTQADTLDLRKINWEKFLDLKPKTKKSQRIHDEYQFLARMGYPLLLILIRQPHVVHNIEGLSHLSGMSVEQVKEGIETLIGLGAVKKIGDQLVTHTFSFETVNDTPNVATQTFHRNMLLKAADTVSRPPSEREFRSVLVPLNQEEFSYVQKRLRQLSIEIDEMFGGPRPKSQKIYALNMNLIPMTPDFIQTADSPLRQKSEDLSITQEKVL